MHTLYPFLPKMNTFLASILAYLLGSLSSAILLARVLRLPDPRTQGSNNPGATNMLRLGGKKVGAATLVGDALKGWVAVFLAKYFNADDLTLNCVFIAVFLGHLFPLYFHFKGGKGVATALGALLGLDPILGFAVLLIWIGVAFCWRLSSLASLASSLAMPGLIFLWHPSFFYTASLISTFIAYTHRSNIKRLISRKEPRF